MIPEWGSEDYKRKRGGVEGLVRVRVWVGCVKDGIGKGKSVVYRRGKKTGYKRGNIVVMRVVEMAKEIHVKVYNEGKNK